MRLFNLMRQRPTLPHVFTCSTIGSEGLNFRVRDGNGWDPFDKATGNLLHMRKYVLAAIKTALDLDLRKPRG